MSKIESYIETLRINPNGTVTADVSELADILEMSFAQARRALREECQRLGYRINGSTIDKKPGSPVRKRVTKADLKAAARQVALQKALYSENSGDEV